MNTSISGHKQFVARTVVDFIQTVFDRNRLLKKRGEIGDKDGIKTEISRLTTTLELLSKEYDVTEDEVTLYQAAIESVRQLVISTKMLESDKVTIGQMASVLQKRDISLSNISTVAFELETAITEIQDFADARWLVVRDHVLEKIDKQTSDAQTKLAEHQISIDKLKPKMEGNDQIGKMSAAIIGENEKLDKLTNIDNELQEVQKRYSEQIAVLTSAFETYAGFILSTLTA